jgi:hypothetical protein
MKRRCILFPGLAVLLLVTARPLPAQEGNLLRGQVFDEKTATPVFYAKIGLVDGDLTTFTDLSGEFVLDSTALQPSDTLVFSSLQYEPTKVPVAALQHGAGVIRLRRRNVGRGRSPVKSIQPEALVRLAADAAFQQYDRTSATREISFRERVREVNDGQEVLSATAQGLFSWYKSAYNAPDAYGSIGVEFRGKRDSVYSALLRSYNAFLVTPYSYPLQRGTRITNFPQANPRYKRLYNGYNPCFYHQADLEELDAFRYPESFLNLGRIDQYQFYLLDYLTLNGEQVTVIGFGPKSNWVTRAYFTGRIFIIAREKAVIRADFQLAPGELVLFNYNATVETVQRTYEVHYAKQEDGWFFDGGSIRTAFSRRPYPSRFLSVIDFKASSDPAVVKSTADGPWLDRGQPFVSQLPDAAGNRP